MAEDRTPSFHPLPPTMRPLHPDASMETMFHALQEALANYANMAAAHNHNWPVVIDSLTHIRHELKSWKSEHAEMLARIDRMTLRAEDHSSRLAVLERAPMRNEEVSRHDWSEELDRLGRELTARVKDRSDPLDSIRAKEIATDVVRAAEEKRELGRWRLTKGWVAGVATKLVTASLFALMGYLAAHLWH